VPKQGGTISPDKRKPRSTPMAWTTPIVAEICVGMEVTSYESAEI
jgi:coenzyme PQQ precursor peptide PqqA